MHAPTNTVWARLALLACLLVVHPACASIAVGCGLVVTLMQFVVRMCVCVGGGGTYIYWRPGRMGAAMKRILHTQRTTPPPVRILG